MKLSDVLLLNQNLTIELLQKGYEPIIRKIRLKNTILPIMLTGNVIKYGFNNELQINAIGSKVRIKDFDSFICSSKIAETTYDETNGTVNIGNLADAKYGFSQEVFDECNDWHTDNYSVVHKQDRIIVDKDPTDTDQNVLLLCNCYVYPYPVITNSDPYNVEYRYDIQWMVTTYGISNIEMDSLIAVLSAIKALSIFYNDNLDLGKSMNYEYYLANLINKFNSNVETYGIATGTKISGDFTDVFD